MSSTDPVQAEEREYGEFAAEPVLPSTSRGSRDVAARGLPASLGTLALVSTSRGLGRRGVPLGQQGHLCVLGALCYQDAGKALKDGQTLASVGQRRGGRGMSLTSSGGMRALVLPLPSCLIFGPVTLFLCTSEIV